MKKWFKQWLEDLRTEPRLDMPNDLHRRLWAARDIRDCLVAMIVIGVVLLAMALFCGCHTYTVVPADRRMVPVRHAPEVSDEVYLRTEGKGATGWYVPDAVMLELLDAE